MVKTFSKPQAARQVEARARARQCGVKVEVVSEARHYRTRSQSQPGTVYTILRTPAGWACECEGYFHTGICKHIAQVERRAEREGWRFGLVAPLATVARHFPLTPEPAAPKAEAPGTRTVEELRTRKAAALADLYGDVA